MGYGYGPDDNDNDSPWIMDPELGGGYTDFSNYFEDGPQADDNLTFGFEK